MPLLGIKTLASFFPFINSTLKTSGFFSLFLLCVHAQFVCPVFCSLRPLQFKLPRRLCLLFNVISSTFYNTIVINTLYNSIVIISVNTSRFRIIAYFNQYPSIEDRVKCPCLTSNPRNQVCCPSCYSKLVREPGPCLYPLCFTFGL